MQPTSPVAVVTGASSGIGKAIAEAFSMAGWTTIVHGNQNIQSLQTEKNRLAIVADLSNTSRLASMVDTAFHRYGFVDAWVNAAGADVITGDRQKLSFEEKLERLWAVDVRACLGLSRLVSERMKMQSDRPDLPSIVNMGWDQAPMGMEGDSGQYFAATKSAVMAFTKSLAKSVGPRVRVNCVAPGWIKTAWGKTASAEWQHRAINESCLKRWGFPEDIANAVLFLASPQSNFINGQVLNVNGGWKPSNS